LCACGFENGYDIIFCEGCGIILNVKRYEEEIKSKDTEVNSLKAEIEGIKEMLKDLWKERKI